jgi:hypothetical protein
VIAAGRRAAFENADGVVGGLLIVRRAIDVELDPDDCRRARDGEPEGGELQRVVVAVVEGLVVVGRVAAGTGVEAFERGARRRFLLAVILLNVLPLIYGAWVARVVSHLPGGFLSLVPVGLASFLPFGCWRLFAAIVRTNEGWFFKDDPLKSAEPLGSALKEIATYSAFEHFLGTVLYFLFAVPSPRVLVLLEVSRAALCPDLAGARRCPARPASRPPLPRREARRSDCPESLGPRPPSRAMYPRQAKTCTSFRRRARCAARASSVGRKGPEPMRRRRILAPGYLTIG